MSFDLSNTVYISPKFNIWSGRVKLDAKDIPEAARKMPPKELASAGSIKIFPPEELHQFRNFKTRVALLCQSKGLQFDNGWLVDASILPEIEQELAACHADWMAALQDFVDSYTRTALDWAASCGEWASLVQGKQPMQSEIASRFRFSWSTFRLTQAASDAQAGNDTEESVQSIPDKALQSVIDSLKELYDNSFAKSGDPSGKAYNALRKIADRAEALGFANPNAARLAPVLRDMANNRNHALTRLVLSRMDDAQGVLDVLQVEASGAGIESLLLPPPAPQAQDTDVLLSDAAALLDEPMTRPIKVVGLRQQRERYDAGLISKGEYNKWLNELVEEGSITQATCDKWLIPDTPSLSSDNVLDSLGLF